MVKALIQLLEYVELLYVTKISSPKAPIEALEHLTETCLVTGVLHAFRHSLENAEE